MLYYLNGLFVGLLILSNVLAVKLFSIGDWIVLPAAVIIYVFTYPILDVITEAYGKEAARRTVLTGFLAQVLAIGFIWIAIKLPAASFYENQESFELIFTAGFRVTIASLAAYLVSQNLDVTIFDKLKNDMAKRSCGSEITYRRWPVNLSIRLFSSQLLFTARCHWAYSSE